MRKSLTVIILTLAVSPVIAENEVSFEKLSANQFRLKLTSDAVLDLEVAQELLAPKAVSLCNGKYPQYGHYQFNSSETVAARSDSAEPNTFELIQDIECVDAPTTSAPDQRSFIADANAQQVIEEQVRTLSETYFSDIFGGNYKEAFEFLSENMRSYRNFDEWTAQMDDIRNAAGEVVTLNIHTITVYDNPPNAPQPGLYVAADYQNSFENAPYHCGYLLWFRAEVGDFRITREETGLLTNEVLSDIPSEQHPSILAQMRCSAR